MGGTSWRSSYYRWGRPAKFLARILVVVLLSGGASTNVPPTGYQGKPSTADPLPGPYLARGPARLVPEEAREAGAPAPRIAVFRDPTLNAFAMPNGKIYIHTGLLSRVENK